MVCHHKFAASPSQFARTFSPCVTKPRIVDGSQFSLSFVIKIDGLSTSHGHPPNMSLIPKHPEMTPPASRKGAQRHLPAKESYLKLFILEKANADKTLGLRAYAGKVVMAVSRSIMTLNPWDILIYHFVTKHF